GNRLQVEMSSRQYGEFVAADSSDKLGLAAYAAQAHRHLLEVLVTHRVTGRIVDLLEFVEVDQQQRARRLPFGRQLAQLEQLGLELAAVRKPGHDVELREVSRPVRLDLLLGDVLLHAEDTDGD